jgi:hypothetical protein
MCAQLKSPFGFIARKMEKKITEIDGWTCTIRKCSSKCLFTEIDGWTCTTS